MAAPSSTYTNSTNLAVLRTVLRRSKEIIAQELIQSYLYYIIAKRARKVQCWKQICIPMVPSFGEQGEWIGSNSTLTEGVDPTLIDSVWNNRYMATPVTTNYLEDMEDKGDPDTLWTKAELNATFAGVGSARKISNAIINGVGGLEPDGILGNMLEKLVPASQVKTVGGLSKSTNTWWRNPYTQLTSNFGTIVAGSTVPAGILAAREVIKKGTVGVYRPTDFITNQDIFEMFRRAAIEMYTPYMIVCDKKSVDLGFETIKWEGLEIGWDYFMPADTVMALHLGKDVKDKRGLGAGASELDVDADLENTKLQVPIELVGQNGISLIVNKNVDNELLEGTRERRGLKTTYHMLRSLNVFMNRMLNQAVGGSDNGSRWSTW